MLWGRPLLPWQRNFGKFGATFAKKSPISRLVWQIDLTCFGLPWADQGADPCCHGNDISARRGDLIAYRLVFSSVGLWLTLSIYQHDNS